MLTVSTGGETRSIEGPWVRPTGVLDGGFPTVGPSMSDAGLKTYAGDITVTPTNSPTGLHVTGKLILAGGTVTNCVVHGHRNVTAQDAIVTGRNYDSAGTILDRVRLDGRGTESPWKNGIDGGNYTLRNSEILGVVDGIGANYAGKAIIEGCRIYHGWYEAWNDKTLGKPRTATFADAYGVTHLAPFPSQASGDSHGDGAQLFGWAGWVLRFNSIGGKRGTTASTKLLDPTILADADVMRALAADPSFNNTAIMVNAVAAHPVGALIEGNWLEGGAAVINLQTVTGDLLAGVTIRNNIITSGTGFGIYASQNHLATITGNRLPDGTAVVTKTRTT